MLVYFFQAILIGAALGAAAGVCFLIREVWRAIFGEAEEDDQPT